MEVRIPPSPPLRLPERRLIASIERSTEKITRFRGVLAIRASRMRTGDGGFAVRFERSGALVSVAKLGGSLSLSMRLGEEQDSVEQLWLHDSQSAVTIPCAQVGSSAGVPQSNPSCAFCSAQSRGRSTRFVSSCVVSGAGWLPERMLATMSGAKKASGIRLAT